MDFPDFLEDIASISFFRLYLFLGISLISSFSYLDGALLYYLLVDHISLPIWIMEIILCVAALFNIYFLITFFKVFIKVNRLKEGSSPSESSIAYFHNFSKNHDLFSIYSIVKLLTLISIVMFKKEIYGNRFGDLGNFLGTFSLIIVIVYLFNSTMYFHSSDFKFNKNEK